MALRRSWLWLWLLLVLALTPISARAADLCAVKTQAGRDALVRSPPTLPGAQSHVYKTAGDLPLRLYVFQPKDRASAPRSAIVFFYGGGWMFGNVNRLVPQARYFAARGAVVILADYRVFCRDKVSIVEEMKDAKAAVRWVRAHAPDLHVAPDRIAVWGGSAGGHLALSTAMFDHIDDESGGPRAVSPRPDLLLLFYPCVDETSPEEALSAQAIQTYGAEVSPILHVGPGLPPMLVVQGTADSLYGENKAYCAKVAAAGNSCSLVEFQKAPHGFFQDLPDSQHWYRAGLLEMEAFLIAHGYLAAS